MSTKKFTSLVQVCVVRAPFANGVCYRNPIGTKQVELIISGSITIQLNSGNDCFWKQWRCLFSELMQIFFYSK